LKSYGKGKRNETKKRQKRADKNVEGKKSSQSCQTGKQKKQVILVFSGCLNVKLIPKKIPPNGGIKFLNVDTILN
jgi:hypothetical protein